MKIAIHSQPGGSALGGAEVCAAVFAYALRGRDEVNLLHHRPHVTREQWADFSEVDLDGVNVRYVPETKQTSWRSGDESPLTISRETRRWRAELSDGYDLFVTLTHAPPPYCHAARGALYILFPFYDRTSDWPWTVPSAGLAAKCIAHGRRFLYERAWQEIMSGYAVRWAISDFTRRWTESRWGIDCDLLNPPIRVEFARLSKSPTILMLGRFVPVKRQLEVVRMFRSLGGPLSNWELICIGSRSADAGHVEYLKQVEAEADSRVRFVFDAPREEVRRLLAEGSIFIHAMGLGVNESERPEKAEHFGMATAEAMAAGCVPITLNKGGQREIVEHGVSGFLCDDIEEMALRLTEAAGYPESLVRMQAAARERAQRFSRDSFIHRVRQTLLSETEPRD